MSRFILALDQGTTSSRALVFDEHTGIRGVGQYEFPQHFPASGWVEHEAEDLWTTTIRAARDAIARAGVASRDIAAIGITNQRETVVVWDRATGEAIHRAIVWQDRRTADVCQALREAGHEADVAARTGLLLDPYFSAAKIAWILDHVPGARARAERGELAFGTVDSWLLWKLTGGAVHATDATNASRTQLYNIVEGRWDETLLELFRVPASLLPQVRDSSGDFGQSLGGLFTGPIPIRGVAGDQQAAMIGQACFQPGTMKATYGTGCFALLNTGDKPVASKNRLLTTVAYQIDGKRAYALEGSIFVAGAAVQWLRDGLKTLPAEHAAIVRFAAWRSPINHMTAFMRLDAVRDCGGYPEIATVEDYALWLRLIARGYRLANLARVLVHVRLGEDFLRRRTGPRRVAAERALHAIRREVDAIGPLTAWAAVLARSAAVAFEPPAALFYALSRR